MWKNFKEKTLYQPIGITIIELVLLYLIIVNLDRIFGGIGTFLSVISPFIMGAVIAYLLNKPALAIQRILEKSQRVLIAKKAQKLSVVLVFLLLITIVSVVVNFAIPIVESNVRDFAANVTNYYNVFLRWVNNFGSGYILYGLLPNSADLLNLFLDLVTLELVTQVGDGAVQVVGHIVNITAWIVNFFLALIAALYMLLAKDNIMALIRRLLRLFMSDATYDSVASYAEKSNRIFYTFVRAQFLDACILGTLATIILAILGVPYALTFGIILGICNMIPIFGSIIATIITVIVTIFTGGLALAVITLVALLILQQIDANFIGPKITGDALGLKPLLIIFAIVLGGAYFGIIGMFISVPVAAMLKMFLEDFMDARERKLRIREEKPVSE